MDDDNVTELRPNKAGRPTNWKSIGSGFIMLMIFSASAGAAAGTLWGMAKLFAKLIGG